MAIPYLIRAARSEDVPQLRLMLIETWHQAYDGILGKDAVDKRCRLYFEEPVLRRYLGTDTWTPVAVTPDEKIIAFMTSRVSLVGGVNVSMLYVLPSHQRQGIGRALMLTLPHMYPAMRWTSLEVLEPNTPAIGFYEGLGFQRWSKYGMADGVPILSMTRRAETTATWWEALRAFVHNPPKTSTVFQFGL